MSWISKTLRVLSPNCQEAVRLQSDALDRPLSPAKRLGLRIHLLLCKWCRRYGRQIAFLRIVAQNCDHEHESDKTLPAEARERIQRALKSAKN